MSDYESKVKIKVDDAELDAAQKKIDGLKNKEVKVDVGVNDKATDQISNNLNRATQAAQGTNTAVKSTGVAFKDANAQAKSLSSTMKNMVVGSATYKSIELIEKAAKQAAEAIKEMDSAIVDLQNATGSSYSDIRQLLSSYNDFAKQLGSTTTELASGADSWLRQGKSISETNELLKDTMVLSKVAQLDSESSTEYLTAIMNGYKKTVDEISEVNDSLTSIDMVAAVDAGGLAEATSRVAATADLAGVELNKLLGYEAAIGEASQESMSVIGNSLKTIFTRMSDIKSGKLELVDEDGTVQTLSDVETVLNNINVPLRDSKNEFRDFDDVLDDVASKWKSLSSVQQAAVSKAFAGTYQRNRFQLLMENYDKALEYEKIAETSSGTAMAKFEENYLNSIEAKVNTLQASFESLAFNAISRETVTGILDAASALTEFVDKTNLLKGALSGLAVSGGIKGFTMLATAITQAVMKLNNFNSALNLVKVGNLGTSEIEQLGTLLHGLTQSQQKAILSTQMLSTEQRIQALTIAGMSQAEAQAAIATMGLATAEGTATGATVSLSGALRGLGALMLQNPLVLIATAITTGVMAFSKIKEMATEAGLTLEGAQQNAQESAEAYQTTISEVESLNSELQTTRQRIEELQGLDSLTIAEESELAKLQQENEQLEQQIALKEKLAQAQSLQAAADAKNAINMKSESRQGVIYDENGNAVDEGSQSLTRIDYVKQQLSEIASLEKDIKEKEAELTDVAPNSKEYQSLEKDINHKKSVIQDYESELTSIISDLSSEAEGLYDSNGKIIEGYEDEAKAVEEVIDLFNNRSLSDGEKKLAKIQKYFSGSSRRNRIKDDLLSIVKAGGKTGDVVKALEAMGINLEDAGLDADTLVRYFQEMADAANETASATEKVNNNLTMEEVEQAFESANAGDDYVALNGYLDKAKELYDQGLVGTDDFKTVAELISYNIDSSAESFLANYNKLQRYFTEDSDGNLTAQGIHNFLTDLQALNKGYAEFKDGKWNLEMDNTAQAAKDMGLSVQSFESMLGRLQDYDNVGEFQFVSAIKEFNEAQESLEGLKSICDELEDSDYKDMLKLKLDEWSPMIDAAEDDLASLPREIVTKLKFEYDLAQIQQELQEANDLWESGDRSQELGAERITLAKQYREKREEQTGYTEETGDTAYANSYKAITHLQEQFNNAMDESTRASIQDQIYSVYELQNAFQDAFANGEIKDWSSYLKTNEAIDAMNQIMEATGMTESQLEALFGMDLNLGLNADVSNIGELKETIDSIKNGGELKFFAEVDGEGVSEIKALKDEEGKITYQVEIDGELQELQMLPTEDGSVVFGIKVEDEATPVIDEITQREVEAKIVEVIGEDNASYVIDYWNQKLQVEPKLATLSAEDQATWVINEWNAMTPIAQQGFMDGTITLTDNTAEGTESAKSNLNSVPTTTDTEINTTSNTGTAVSLARGLLDGFNGHTAHTYIVTHKSTVSDLAGTAHVGGTAHLSGTAHAGGTVGDNSWLKNSWKTKKDEVALTGEEGMELVATRNDGWFTVGEEGAEFSPIPAGSVVFNARQTKELLSKGRIKGRGRNHLSGTAYLGSSLGGLAFEGGASIYNTGSSVASSSSNTANTTTASEEAEEFKEDLDWIERKLKEVERQIENLDQTVAATYKSWSERNTALSKEISKVNEEISIQQQAYERYMQQANSVGLSDAYKQLIQAGKIDIETITDEDLKEQIDDYQNWYDKALDCQDAMQDLQDDLADLAETRFDGIVTQFENLLSVIEHSIELTETAIDKVEAEGYLVSTKMYEMLKKSQTEQIATLQEELNSLNSALTTAMNEGNIERYSESWYELLGNIQDVESEIADLNKDLAETNNLIRETSWNLFDKMQDMLGSVQEESDWLIDLMDNEKMFNTEDASITDYGQATMGLHAVNYNAYMSQADDYAKEILKLNEEIAKDPYNDTLLERRRELIEAQRESISAAKDEKSAIMDLVEEGYSAFQDVLDKIIEKRKNLLSESKDLFDYQKSIEKQVKEISQLEKQLNAYSGDNSESAKKTVQELKVSLENAKSDLQESEMEQYLSDQEKMLDSLTDEVEEFFSLRLEDTDARITEVVEATNENASQIKTTLESEVTSVGTTLSDSMREIWSKEGDFANIITMYGTNFGSALTTTNNVLNDIRNYLKAMSQDSDSKAEEEVKNITTTTATTAKDNNSSPNTTTTPSATTTQKEITVGGTINAGNARIYATSSGTGGGSQYYASDPVYTVIGENNGYLLARYHKLSSGHTGWFKKSDVKAYETGGLVNETGLAWLDGTKDKPELVLNPEDTKNLVEVTSIIREIDTKKLWNLESLDFARPTIDASLFKMPDVELRPVEQKINVTNNIEMNGVNDPQEFAEQLKYALKTDRYVKSIIQSDTLGIMTGHNSLTKFKY